MLANHEIERATLAVAVQHGGDGVMGEVTTHDFDSVQNRTIYIALHRLYSAGTPLDEPSLLAQLQRDEALGDAGGKAGIASLYYHDTALRANLPSYLAQLREAKRRREMSNLLAKLGRDVEQGQKRLAEMFEEVETEVLALTRRVGGESTYISAEEMVTGALSLIDQAYQRGDGLVGYDTGIRGINDIIGGWEAGTFTILMGPPGVGKTALWLQSAIHVAQRAPVALVQLEMTAAKMGMRALTNHSQVSFRKLRRGTGLSERDWSKLSESMGEIAGRQILLAPPGVHEWGDIKSWFRRMHIDHGASMLWLDNLKIIGMPGVKPLDRFNAITRECKVLSRELGVPVVAIHHLHRLEEGKTPSLSSGYGSSSIEQDADNVLALWRPDPMAEDEVQVLPLKTRDDRGQRFVLQWIGDEQRYQMPKPDYDPQPMLYSD